MHIDEMKKMTDEYLIKAQVMLEKDNFLIPLIIAIDNNDEIHYKTMAIETDKDEKELETLLKRLSKEYKSLILILCASVMELPEEARGIDVSFDKSRAIKLLACLIYTKDGTHLRRMPYNVLENKNYHFHDLGWDEIDEATYNFTNPFMD